MNSRSGLILILISFLLAPICLAQSNGSYEDRRAEIVEQQNTTREQIESLREQIETYTERLGFATERYEQMFQQYRELERVITLQQEQIRQMRLEQSQISEEIELIESNIDNNEERLLELMREYKDILTFSYKNGRTTELALLLTSSSFNQLLVRSYYLGKFDEFRKGQVDEIEDTRDDLISSRTDLEEARLRSLNALASIQQETRTLEEQQQQQERNVELLRRDRDQIQEQVDIRQRQLNELVSTLNDLIAEEERIRREEAAGTRVMRSERVMNDEELVAVASEFRNSKGQLPWPIDNGTITQKFGLRIHPVFGTRTNNPGVEISAPPRSTVRVVNDGYVIGVEILPNFGNSVLVHHGGFYTVYGNLSEIYVRKDQVLSRNDVIGLSGDENSLIGEVLFFMVREGTTDLNPEEWLQRAVP
jgi:septal ring factor EnvC (AmiA/AmiB activator)